MQVTRQRRRDPRAAAAPRRARLAVAGATALAVVGAGSGIAYASTRGFGFDQVGHPGKDGLVVSADQIINPIGDRLVINNGKIMADTVSPDGSHLAALTADGGIALTIVDLKSWKVQQLVGTAATANLRISGNDVGQQGPTYSPDGSAL